MVFPAGTKESSFEYEAGLDEHVGGLVSFFGWFC